MKSYWEFMKLESWINKIYSIIILYEKVIIYLKNKMRKIRDIKLITREWNVKDKRKYLL